MAAPAPPPLPLVCPSCRLKVPPEEIPEGGLGRCPRCRGALGARSRGSGVRGPGAAIRWLLGAGVLAGMLGIAGLAIWLARSERPPAAGPVERGVPSGERRAESGESLATGDFQRALGLIGVTVDPGKWPEAIARKARTEGIVLWREGDQRLRFVYFWSGHPRRVALERRIGGSWVADGKQSSWDHQGRRVDYFQRADGSRYGSEEHFRRDGTRAKRIERDLSTGAVRRVIEYDEDGVRQKSTFYAEGRPLLATWYLPDGQTPQRTELVEGK